MQIQGIKLKVQENTRGNEGGGEKLHTKIKGQQGGQGRRKGRLRKTDEKERAQGYARAKEKAENSKIHRFREKGVCACVCV